MAWSKPAVLALAAIALSPAGTSAGLAASGQATVVEGRCLYSDEVIRQRGETLLIVCDGATLKRDGASATLTFGQRSWGPMARFSGDMAGGRLAVSQVALRDGRAVAATGTCELFHRGDGSLSVIACLARAGSRSIAVNFVPSSL